MTATTDARPARDPSADVPRQARRSPAARAVRPAHQPAAECFLALVTLAVIVGFARIFTGATYAVPLIVVGGATHVWLVVARRRGLHLGLAAVATALGFVVLATWLFFRQTAWLALPTTSTADAARSSVSSSWHAFQQVVAPTHPQTGFMLAAAVAVCFAVFLADWAAFRLWAPIEALVPTLTLAGFTMFVGSSRGQILTTMLYVAAAMGFVLEHRVAQRERTTTWLANQVERGSSWLVHVGAALTVAAVLVGALVAPHLPGAGQPGVVHFHGNQAGGGDRITISPLVNIGSTLNNEAAVSLFTVTSARPAYWRLTSLDTFTGQIWESSGKYDSAGGHLSGTLPPGVPDPGRSAEFTQTFTITHLAALWLPAAYVPVSLQTQAFRARYQASSSTLIVDTNLPNSDSQTYQIRSVAPDYAPAQLRAASTTLPTTIRSQDLAVPGLSPSAVALARQVTASAHTPYDKALALQTYFRATGGFTYDASVRFDNSSRAIDTFLRVKRGFCQQFAGTFAALARSVGLPTRVAVGFTPGVQDTGIANQYDVKGGQAHAWPEVYLGQYGWVPFEPTPGRGAPNEGRYLGVPPAQDTGGGGGPNPTVTNPSAPSTVVTAPANPTTTQPRLAPTNPGATGSGRGIDLAAWSGVIGLVLLGGALVYLLAVPSLLALRRRRRRERARDPGSRVRLAWSESEEALELIGQARRSDETAREFATRAGDRLPTQSRGLLTLATVADAALFGADAMDDSVAVAAEETTQALQAIVDDQVPWWRRALNQLDARRLRRPPPG
jgi:transglutaminase-like putative cysteine protease